MINFPRNNFLIPSTSYAMYSTNTEIYIYGNAFIKTRLNLIRTVERNAKGIWYPVNHWLRVTVAISDPTSNPILCSVCQCSV